MRKGGFTVSGAVEFHRHYRYYNYFRIYPNSIQDGFFFPRFENVYKALGILTILLSRLFVARNRFKAYYYRYRYRSGRIYKLLKIYNKRIYLCVLNVFSTRNRSFSNGRRARNAISRIIYFL